MYQRFPSVDMYSVNQIISKWEWEREENDVMMRVRNKIVGAKRGERKIMKVKHGGREKEIVKVRWSSGGGGEEILRVSYGNGEIVSEKKSRRRKRQIYILSGQSIFIILMFYNSIILC